MTDFIQATLNAGLQIALSLNARTPNLYTKHARGAGGDISIGADLLSEEIFIAALSEFGNIDSEEAGFIDNKKAHTIVIDPLDGSDNFLSAIPYYGASVALKNAESRLDSAVDCHDSALYAESRNDEFLDSAKIGIIMNFCNLSAVVSFKGKNYYGNLAQEFSAFTKSTLDSADSQNLVKNNPREAQPLASSGVGEGVVREGEGSDFAIQAPAPSLKENARGEKWESKADLSAQRRGEIDYTNSQNLQGGLPRSHSLARNDEILDYSLRLHSAQNDNTRKIAESRLDSALDCHDSTLYAESRNDEFLDSANLAKCGIFEGAYRNPHICEILHKNNIKFRSLGALALSLGLSERVQFVLFNGKKRHYDTEAGFLIAQNLHKIESENLVLISKDKILFDKISNLLF